MFIFIRVKFVFFILGISENENAEEQDVQRYGVLHMYVIWKPKEGGKVCWIKISDGINIGTWEKTDRPFTLKKKMLWHQKV